MVAFNEYYYNPEEIEKLREQIKNGNKAALEEIKKRGGIKVSPRIAAMREQIRLEKEEEYEPERY